MNIRNIAVLLSLFLIGAVLKASAQESNYNSLLIPKELTKEANQVWRMNYTRFSVQSPKDINLHVKNVVTILNEDSHAMNQWVFYDKNSKITYLKARVYDALGQLIRTSKKSDFSDNSAISGGTMYSDSRYKMIELHHSSYPYTVEFEYKMTYKGLMHYPDFRIGGFATGVEKAIFIAEMENGLELRYKAVNIDLEPEIVRSDKTTSYSWTVENQPPVQWEEMMPNRSQVLPYIAISPSEFFYDGYEGDFSSWESYGRFFYDLNKTQTSLSPVMSQKVAELTRDAKTNKEKIDILYRYLQDNTRYVGVQLGIGGYQAFDAGYVETNQYGDCKALSNFMLSMLKAVDIKAYHAIIFRDADDKNEVDEDFAAHFGNHMVIYLPDEDIWLECTSNDYPLNYLGKSNDDRPVMLLTEEGGKLTRSPAFKSTENTHQAKANIKISKDGSAIIENQIKFYGPKHERYRSFENNYSEKEQDEWFLKTMDLPAFNIEKLEFTSSKDNPEAQMDYQIFVGRYASKAGKRIFLPVNKLNAFQKVPPPIEKRRHPVQVIRSYSESDEYIFELPEGYAVESIPDRKINLQTEFGSYVVKTTIEGSYMTYQRDLVIFATQLPAEQYEAFRDFRKEIAKADGMKVVLVKKKT